MEFEFKIPYYCLLFNQESKWSIKSALSKSFQCKNGRQKFQKLSMNSSKRLCWQVLQE